ncbi:MAG: polyprenyl synthetase family protein [Candidatus Binatia bacterium]
MPGRPRRCCAGSTAYGEHLGLAFEIADDVLDAVEEADADGRTDRELGKVTYPAALGMDGAIAAAARERLAALRAVGPLGAVAEPLRALADYVVARAEAVRADAPAA